jgi:hypothetical protein
LLSLAVLYQPLFFIRFLRQKRDETEKGEREIEKKNKTESAQMCVCV